MSDPSDPNVDPPAPNVDPPAPNVDPSATADESVDEPEPTKKRKLKWYVVGAVIVVVAIAVPVVIVAMNSGSSDPLVEEYIENADESWDEMNETERRVLCDQLDDPEQMAEAYEDLKDEMMDTLNEDLPELSDSADDEAVIENFAKRTENVDKAEDAASEVVEHVRGKC